VLEDHPNRRQENVMKIAVLGTGMVGNAIATKLVQLGHEVKMGAREARNEKAVAWARAHEARAGEGSFADAAAFGELLFNCTLGSASLEVLKRAGAQNLEGKILIDVSNPLDFTNGMPPSLLVSNTDSLGEQLQRAFPKLRVVKTLNTMNCHLMVDASRINGGDHDLFMCGNDAAAKAQVLQIVREWFGWKNVYDLGDITNARATESLLPLWVRLYGHFKSPDFNFKIVR
jgi:8-hydroxy-5-deazaflavin:NADPH oxidoreductase